MVAPRLFESDIVIMGGSHTILAAWSSRHDWAMADRIDARQVRPTRGPPGLT